jgi:hypothetical protein
MDCPIFYISHYPNSELACKMLSVCIQSIQKYYPESECWVLYTPSTYPVNLPIHPKLHVEETPVLNSSVIGGFKKYLDSGDTRKAIFIHDSVFLKGTFSTSLEMPFGFIWHFSEHSSISKDVRIYDIELPYFREEASDFLNKYPGLNWVGCFGCCLFSDRPSLLQLWNSIDFILYTIHPQRAKALMDLERIIGIHAYALGLIPQGEKRSLCGNIFDMPNNFIEWYKGQDLSYIEQIAYSQPAVKAWCRRFIKES